MRKGWEEVERVEEGEGGRRGNVSFVSGVVMVGVVVCTMFCRQRKREDGEEEKGRSNIGIEPRPYHSLVSRLSLLMSCLFPSSSAGAGLVWVWLVLRRVRARRAGWLAKRVGKR